MILLAKHTPSWVPLLNSSWYLVDFPPFLVVQCHPRQRALMLLTSSYERRLQLDVTPLRENGRGMVGDVVARVVSNWGEVLPTKIPLEPEVNQTTSTKTHPPNVQPTPQHLKVSSLFKTDLYHIHRYPPETNIAPLNWWLEDYHSFGMPYFPVLC